MRQCLYKYSFTLSKENPHNIRDIVALIFSLCLVGVILWVMPWLGYQVVECNYARNTSMDCICELNYSYTNCFLPGLLLVITCVLALFLLLLIIHIYHKFHIHTLPIWRDNIKNSIKPISYIIAVRGHGESQYLINTIPPTIYNKKWTQLQFMISDDNPDSLISPEQKRSIKVMSIAIFFTIVLFLLSPFFGTLIRRKYCSGDDTIHWICDPDKEFCNITASNSSYIFACFPLGFGFEWIIIIVLFISMLFIGSIGACYRRTMDSVRDLPEIVALQGNNNI